MHFERDLLEKRPMLVEKTGFAYRYGFQGQESDDEVKGAGNSVNYKYRMHDPRVGRFFAVDPLASKYPHNSPYAFSENRLIDRIELEGLESYIPDVLTTDYWNNWFDKTVNNLEYGIQKSTSKTINTSLALSLIYVSKLMLPTVSKLTEEDKQVYFEYGEARETEAILLYEMASGTGKDLRSFGEENSITADIFQGYVLSEIEEAFSNITKSQFETNGLTGSISFSPTKNPNSWLESADKHVVSTPSQFFMGGAVFKAEPILGSNDVNVTITNVTSRSSAGLHLLEDYNDGALESKTQTYHKKITIQENQYKQD
jgi:RHS repeat-associated protein